MPIKPRMLVLLAMPLLLTGCLTKPTKPYLDTTDQTAKIYCDGLEPEPLGTFMWTDADGQVKVGISEQDFDLSYSGLRAWTVARFDTWAKLCARQVRR